MRRVERYDMLPNSVLPARPSGQLRWSALNIDANLRTWFNYIVCDGCNILFGRSSNFEECFLFCRILRTYILQCILSNIDLHMSSRTICIRIVQKI